MPTDNFHSNKIWKDCDCLLPRHAISARHASLVADTATRRLQTGSSCFRLRPWYVPVSLPRRLHPAYWSQWTAERLRSAQRGDLYVPAIRTKLGTRSCCAGNMEFFTATYTFTNHQPRSVPDWTQILPLQSAYTWLYLRVQELLRSELTNLLTNLLT